MIIIDIVRLKKGNNYNSNNVREGWLYLLYKTVLLINIRYNDYMVIMIDKI